MGLAESLVCMGAYLWVFKSYGVSASQIFLLNPKADTWLSQAELIDPSSLVVVNGAQLSPEVQEKILREVLSRPLSSTSRSVQCVSGKRSHHRVTLVQAISAWYITLIMSQFWHIWFCKTRRVSVFKHPGLWENRVTFYGVAFALAVMIICTYVPWLQDHVFYNASPPGLQAWVPHFFFLVFCAVYTEGTKFYARRYPNSYFARHIIW
jgi:magnesium-transporting ATPase (P-type)